MSKQTRPIGVLILGGVNFLILGLGSLLVLAVVYFRSDSQSFGALLEEMGKYLPEAELGESIIKKAILTQMMVAAIFALSGWGLLAGKEIARKATVYFAFFAVAITFVAVLLNRSIIGQAFLQIVYPGALIVYLTNRRVEDYFVAASKEIKPEVR